MLSTGYFYFQKLTITQHSAFIPLFCNLFSMIHCLLTFVHTAAKLGPLQQYQQIFHVDGVTTQVH